MRHEVRQEAQCAISQPPIKYTTETQSLQSYHNKLYKNNNYNGGAL